MRLVLALGLVAASSLTVAADVASQTPLDRGGSTLILDLGVGLQHDQAIGTTHYAVWQSGRHGLFLGVDYAPAFTDPETVHNVDFPSGWELL
jgi:hypothetical protein